MKKLFAFAIIVYSAVNAVHAQDPEGIKLLSYEKFSAAAAVFSQKSDEKSTFYQGYAMLRAGNTEMANNLFSKIATTPLGMVGAGWVELNKNKSAEAKAYFDNALKATKNKDGLIFRFIGEAYTHSLGTKDYAQAVEKLKTANTLLKNNAEIYVALGEAYLAAQDGGNAVVQFEYAAQYDTKTSVPNAKIGSVYYLSRNYPLAKDYLAKALAIDAENPVIYREMGKVHYKLGKYDLAKEQFAKYMSLGELSLDDKALYANILFLGKDYTNAINTISEIIKVDNSRNYLNRLIGYSNFETEKYADALAFMEKFLATQPKEKIIASDYEYYGKSLLKNGKDSLGLLNLVKSAEMDTTKRETWGTVAEAYLKLKKYAEAAKYYSKKIDPDAPAATDWFNVGSAYYKGKDYVNAEMAFSKVIEIKPEAATGYLWRAKTLLAADPEQKQSSAKPHYIKYIEIASLNAEKNKKDLIDAYNYMAADAYNNQSSVALAKEFAQKVLALDAANEQAKAIMNLK